MNDPIPSTFRPHQTLLLVSVGIVWLLMLLVLLAWWLLPRWAPSWVIRHSPWVKPAFQAAVSSGYAGDFLPRVPGWGEAVIAPMESVLRDSMDSKERLLALRALHEIKHPKSVPALILALKDPNPDHIQYAAGQLGNFNDPTSLEPLIAALRRLSPDAAAATTFDIDAIDHPAKFDLISASLLAAPEDWLQGAGCLSLSSCNDPRTLPTLLAHLGRHQTSYLKDDAGCALGGLKSPAATAAIVQALSDGDERRRYGAIIAARNAVFVARQPTGSNLAFDEIMLLPLVKMTTDPAIRVQIAAVESLVYFDDQRALATLLAAVRNGGALALAAIGSVSAMNDDRYVPLVLSALDHTEAAVRLQALDHLQMLGPLDPHRDRILRLVTDPDPAVARAARILAARVGPNPTATPTPVP